jgi:hypothetical protein
MLDNIGSLPFIYWAISIQHSDLPSLPSFVEKYPKIKYAISDRPHYWQQLDLFYY